MFGMFTGEGDFELGRKLVKFVPTIPWGHSIEHAYSMTLRHLESDVEFNKKHGEWSDTDVREMIWHFLESPEFRIKVTGWEGPLKLL